jgi:surface antigen
MNRHDSTLIWLRPLLAATLLFSSLATASNWQFLKEAPIARFGEEDLKRFREAVYATLDTEPDGKTVTWENRETGNYGKITPLDTSGTPEAKCRRVRIFNNAAGRTGESVFHFCRQPDGEWKAAPEGRPR